MKEIRYDHADVSNRDFAMPVEVTTTNDADDAQKATGEQGGYLSDYQRGFCDGVKHANSADKAAEQPHGLARLDAQGLAAICEILADVIDNGADNDGISHRPWEFYPTDHNWREETPETNSDRCDFIAEVKRRIVARTAPTAVNGGKK